MVYLLGADNNIGDAFAGHFIGGFFSVGMSVSILLAGPGMPCVVQWLESSSGDYVFG